MSVNRRRWIAWLVASTVTFGAEWEIRQGPVVVTRHGKPVAVLLSIEDEDELERLVLACTPKLQDILEAAREQVRKTGGIGHKEFWQEMEDETL